MIGVKRPKQTRLLESRSPPSSAETLAAEVLRGTLCSVRYAEDRRRIIFIFRGCVGFHRSRDETSAPCEHSIVAVTHICTAGRGIRVVVIVDAFL